MKHWPRSQNVRGVLWLSCLCALLFTSTGLGQISGRVTTSQDGRAIASGDGVAVYFRPDEPIDTHPEADEFVMATEGKRFSPRVLMVPVGATVRFPNNDPILHNVFSSSTRNRFDVGLYGPGEGKTHRFESPGLVRVFCNVHQSMIGHILVLDTPYRAIAGPDGSFELTNTPEVPGTLYVWHERARRPSMQKITPPAADLGIDLELTARQVPNHKNKHGRSYRRERSRY